MSIGVFWFGSVVALAAAIHEKPTRTFTATDGRQITATLDGYNVLSKEVTIRLEGGRKHDLPLERFSEADQVFILDWFADYEASFVRIDFFTNRIDGGRVVFMLDSSGSMRGDRWEKMIRNMCEVIDRVDRRAEFNIILFGSGARVFQPDLVRADESNKREAQSWLRSQYPSGQTNLLAAVKAAKPMEKAQVYAILSDGYPSNEPMDIFDAIAANSAGSSRDIRVYGVSYQASGKGQDFLRDLSERFDGRFARR